MRSEGIALVYTLNTELIGEVNSAEEVVEYTFKNLKCKRLYSSVLNYYSLSQYVIALLDNEELVLCRSKFIACSFLKEYGKTHEIDYHIGEFDKIYANAATRIRAVDIDKIKGKKINTEEEIKHITVEQILADIISSNHSKTFMYEKEQFFILDMNIAKALLIKEVEIELAKLLKSVEKELRVREALADARTVEHAYRLQHQNVEHNIEDMLSKGIYLNTRRTKTGYLVRAELSFLNKFSKRDIISIQRELLQYSENKAVLELIRSKDLNIETILNTFIITSRTSVVSDARECFIEVSFKRKNTEGAL